MARELVGEWGWRGGDVENEVGEMGGANHGRKYEFPQGEGRDNRD